MQLFDPIKSTVNIDPLPSEDDPNEDKAIWVDRAKARYISGYMLNQRKQWEKVSMMKKRMSFIARSSGQFLIDQ